MKYVFAILTFVFGLITATVVGGVINTILEINEYEWILPIALEGTLDFFDAQSVLWGNIIGLVLIPISSYILFAIFLSLFRKYNRRKKATLNHNDIKGPFILYLRSFLDDKTTSKNPYLGISTKSEEEHLVASLSDIAPVYAIGDPKDTEMPNGASRIYVDDEHWKSVVEELSGRALLVVLRLGKTDSFWWEVEMATRKLSIQKIVFIVPHHKTMESITTLSNILAAHNIDCKISNFDVKKRRKGSISSIIYFDEQNKMQVKQVRIYKFTSLLISYDTVIKNALDAVRQKFGCTPNSKLPVRKARTVVIGLLALLLIFSIAIYHTKINEIRYMVPLELAELYVQDQGFVEKYGSEISYKTMIDGHLESQKGFILLSDNDLYSLLSTEIATLACVKPDELEHVNDGLRHMLLMIKKYKPGEYNLYIKHLATAASYAINYPQFIDQANDYYNNLELDDHYLEVAHNLLIKMENREFAEAYQIMEAHNGDKLFLDVLRYSLFTNE